MNKEELKKFLELKEELLVPKLAPKLSPYAKIIYLLGLVVLALSVLGAIATIFVNFSVAILMIAFDALLFIMLRMFCEFLMMNENN